MEIYVMILLKLQWSMLIVARKFCEEESSEIRWKSLLRFLIICIIAPHHFYIFFHILVSHYGSLETLNSQFSLSFQGTHGLEQRRNHRSDDGGDGGARNGRKTAHQSCTGSPEAWPKSLEEEDGVGERRRSARRWETSREVRDWWTSSPTRLIICHHTQLVTWLRNRSYACCHGFTPIITSIVSASFTPHLDKRRWFPYPYLVLELSKKILDFLGSWD